MRPSLETIAEKAGVSTATVSRALNGRAGVNTDTREKILRIVREMGYAPSMNAKGLATSRTYTLGVVLSDRPPQEPITSFPDETLQGADQEARERGYHIITTFVDKAAMQDAHRMALVREQRTDGLIMVGPALKTSFIIQLASSDIPIVLVDNLLNETPIDSVLCDNVGGTYAVTRHLIQTHGLRRLVFISGPTEWLSSRERHQGYAKALAEIEGTPRVIFEEDTTMYQGHGAMLEALERFPDLEGIVAVNDATAIGAIRACKERGIRVPEEIAVVGFDNVGWAPLHDPPLTTVRVFWREVVIQATRRLVDRIERQIGAGFELRLSTELIVRRSCGCIPDEPHRRPSNG